jgi:hypothetical protein
VPGFILLKAGVFIFYLLSEIKGDERRKMKGKERQLYCHW